MGTVYFYAMPENINLFQMNPRLPPKLGKMLMLLIIFFFYTTGDDPCIWLEYYRPIYCISGIFSGFFIATVFLWKIEFTDFFLTAGGLGAAVKPPAGSRVFPGGGPGGEAPGSTAILGISRLLETLFLTQF